MSKRDIGLPLLGGLIILLALSLLYPRTTVSVSVTPSGWAWRLAPFCCAGATACWAG